MFKVKIEYHKGQHLPVLDGMRGVAILLVILVHLFRYYKWVSFGWMGVDLFFVLSGFLITGILVDTRANPGYYKNFLVRRVLRIFPLYYFFLIVFFIGLPLSSLHNQVEHYTYLDSNQFWFWAYIQNWLFVTDSHYPEINIISHFWSLAIEEQFYIVWPIVVYFFSGRNLKTACIALIIGSILFRTYLYFQQASWIVIYESTFTRLDGLAIGALIALLIREEKGRQLLEKWMPLVLILSASIVLSIIIITGNYYVNNPLLQTVGYTLIDLFCGGLLVILVSSSPIAFIKGIFDNRLLVFLGKYSYGLYVYHKPVYYFTEIHLAQWISSREAMSFIGIILSIGVAVVSYRLLEAPFLRLKDKLSQ